MTDKDLDAIRSRPAFRQFLAELTPPAQSATDGRP